MSPCRHLRTRLTFYPCPQQRFGDVCTTQRRISATIFSLNKTESAEPLKVDEFKHGYGQRRDTGERGRDSVSQGISGKRETR